MSYQLPDGATVAIATVYGVAKSITAITNAVPAAASSIAHGLENGSLFELTSGWQPLNSRIFRVAGQTANSLNIDGTDTSSISAYIPGGGIGSLREIQQFTNIPQITEFATSGGDQQFSTFSFLEENFERQLPTLFSAQSLSLTMADDPSQPGIIAMQTATDARAIRAVKLSLPSGSSIIYNGYVSYNPTPTLTKGQIMSVKATVSLVGRAVRYVS